MENLTEFKEMVNYTLVGLTAMYTVTTVISLVGTYLKKKVCK